MIADTFRLDPERMTWIEHYPLNAPTNSGRTGLP
jgi:hypothetical protein